MPVPASSNHIGLVALLAEGVDRNIMGLAVVRTDQVALLAEGVDRNKSTLPVMPGTEVALLAEGVDRNIVAIPCEKAWGCRPPRGGRG